VSFTAPHWSMHPLEHLGLLTQLTSRRQPHQVSKQATPPPPMTHIAAIGGNVAVFQRIRILLPHGNQPSSTASVVQTGPTLLHSFPWWSGRQLRLVVTLNFQKSQSTVPPLHTHSYLTSVATARPCYYCSTLPLICSPQCCRGFTPVALTSSAPIRHFVPRVHDAFSTSVNIGPRSTLA
jgi:hypothetical protein